MPAVPTRPTCCCSAGERLLGPAELSWFRRQAGALRPLGQDGQGAGGSRLGAGRGGGGAPGPPGGGRGNGDSGSELAFLEGTRVALPPNPSLRPRKEGIQPSALPEGELSPSALRKDLQESGEGEETQGIDRAGPAPTGSAGVGRAPGSTRIGRGEPRLQEAKPSEGEMGTGRKKTAKAGEVCKQRRNPLKGIKGMKDFQLHSE